MLGMNIKIICTLNFISIFAVVTVANFCGVAADTLIVILKISKGFYVCEHVICFNESSCAEKLKGEMMNSDLVLHFI